MLGAAALGACGVWLAGTLMHAPSGGSSAVALESVRTGVEALWIVEALAAALAVPRILGGSARAATAGVATLYAVALPLPSVAWLAGAVSAGEIARSILGLAGLGGALAVAARGLGPRLSDPVARNGILAAIELGTAAALWATRDTWLAWLHGLG